MDVCAECPSRFCCVGGCSDIPEAYVEDHDLLDYGPRVSRCFSCLALIVLFLMHLSQLGATAVGSMPCVNAELHGWGCGSIWGFRA